MQIARFCLFRVNIKGDVLLRLCSDGSIRETKPVAAAMPYAKCFALHSLDAAN
jgi:hypothetical protein